MAWGLLKPVTTYFPLQNCHVKRLLMPFGVSRVKFIVLGVVICGAMGYLFWSGMESSRVFYLTLDELGAGKARLSGKGIRVTGQVQEGSIHGSALEGGITFTMTDGVRKLDVRYSGQIPDTFKEGSGVVVEGIYRDKPVFEATTVLARCPSKYQTADVRGSPAAVAKGDAL